MKNIFENKNLAKLGLALLGGACTLGAAFVSKKQEEAKKQEWLDEAVKKFTEMSTKQD